MKYRQCFPSKCVFFMPLNALKLQGIAWTMSKIRPLNLPVHTAPLKWQHVHHGHNTTHGGATLELQTGMTCLKVGTSLTGPRASLEHPSLITLFQNLSTAHCAGKDTVTHYRPGCWQGPHELSFGNTISTACSYLGVTTDRP